MLLMMMEVVLQKLRWIEVQGIGSETPIQEQDAFLHAIYNELGGYFPDLVFTACQVHDSDKSVPVLLIKPVSNF